MPIIQGSGQQINRGSAIMPVTGPGDNRVVAVDNSVIVGSLIAVGENRNAGNADIIT
jgi:hypothetical protein